MENLIQLLSSAESSSSTTCQLVSLIPQPLQCRQRAKSQQEIYWFVSVLTHSSPTPQTLLSRLSQTRTALRWRFALVFQLIFNSKPFSVEFSWHIQAAYIPSLLKYQHLEFSSWKPILCWLWSRRNIYTSTKLREQILLQSTAAI